MVVGHDVGASPGGDDGDLEELREPGQLRGGPRAQDAATGQDDRPLGRCQELDDRADLVVGRARRTGPDGLGRGIVRHRLVEEVLRQREQHGPGTTSERLARRLRDRRWDLARIARLGCPLGETAQCRDLVDLLERVPAQQVPLHLPDRHEHRSRIRAGRVDADRQVCGADRPRPEADRGSAGQLAMRFGHECGCSLVPRGDDADPGGLEGVEEPEERLTGDRERVANARGPEGVGDEAADRARAGLDGRLRIVFGRALRGDVGLGRVFDLGTRERSRPVAGHRAPLPAAAPSEASRATVVAALGHRVGSRARKARGVG